jgi:predicted TIM-barrel fold metal-dependent hydrolase
MPADARIPFCNRLYHPIYAACEEHDLPVCIHFGVEGAGISELPTAGFPSYYLEMRMTHSQMAMAHVASLVCGRLREVPQLQDSLYRARCVLGAGIAVAHG